MTKQVEQNPAGAPEEPMSLGDAFRFIGELAQRAVQGDESAKLALEIIRNQQLAEIQNLELELQVLNIRKVMAATLKFMPLPGKPV